jgi:hypothetical protein
MLNYCGFERHHILMESGLKAVMLSGRAVYVTAPLRVDLGNLSTAALIFGQFVASDGVSGAVLLLGMSTTLALYVGAHLFYDVARQRER